MTHARLAHRGSSGPPLTGLHWHKSGLLAVSLLLVSAVSLYILAQTAALARPVPQDATQVGTLVALQKIDQRVADISWRILANSIDLCPVHRMAVGITLHDSHQYKPNLRSDATVAFRFVEHYPSVLTVASGSPAQLIGVLPNDVLKAVNGASLASADWGAAKSNDTASYGLVDKAMRVLETLPPQQKVTLDFERNGQPFTVSLEPQAICPSRVELVPGNELNGSANGEVAQIYGAVLNWVRNDDELAFVIAHEVAHNVLRHEARIAREHINTGLFAGLGQSGRKLRDMEREADRLSTWMAARGGFDYHIAPDFWRRLTRRSGLGAVLATTHPTAGSRGDALIPVVREIDAEAAAKRAAGGAALPASAPTSGG